MDPRLITRCRQSSRGRHDDRRGGPRRDSLTKRGAAGWSGHLSSLRAFCFCFAFFGISQLGGKEERLKGNKVEKRSHCHRVHRGEQPRRHSARGRVKKGMSRRRGCEDVLSPVSRLGELTYDSSVIFPQRGKSLAVPRRHMWEFSNKGESRRRSVKAAEMGECKRPGLATDSGESSSSG